MTGDEMERTMQFILEQQAQFMANIQILQEQRARDEGRLARLEHAFVQLTELAVSANERMNEQEARNNERYARDTERLSRLERAFVQQIELALSANERMNKYDERMNEHDTRLARVEEAVVMLTRLVGGKDGNG
jgi:hypothetical protein